MFVFIDKMVIPLHRGEIHVISTQWKAFVLYAAKVQKYLTKCDRKQVRM